ncbi:alpha/beta hydrolase fold domain-containing protein [Streptacidiphilus cavernicola]|uniref:Alpha/beta hydrolase fold domain-containing protein n=1 Tax=Streptacidiphilus cavernicola TaxID=3342716 RepID=A0ABV6W530_9ACTN
MLLPITRIALRTLFALPAPLRRRIAGRPVHLDGQELDLDTQLLMTLRRRLGAGSAGRETDLAVVRRQYSLFTAAINAPKIRSVQIRDLAICDDRIPARLYRPAGQATGSPLLVYFHGGGFVLGDLDSHDHLCRLIAAHGDLAVLSVDYRLAPEHPFPAAVEDSVAAVEYAIAHADALGIDPNRIALGGDSAGGNLAIVTALQVKGPMFVLAFYPVVEATTAPPLPSRTLFGNGLMLTEKDIALFDAMYIRDASQYADWRVAPIHAPNLADLPPLYLATAGFDVVRDEGELFAHKAAEAGVQVVQRRHERLTHGFANMTQLLPAANDAVLEAVAALRLAIYTTSTGGPGEGETSTSRRGAEGSPPHC